MLCYSFCAEFFAQIFYGANLFEKIKELDLSNNYFYDRESKSLKKGLFLLSKPCELSEVKADFTRLFIADLGGTKAPPFASFYYLAGELEIYSQNSVQVFEKYKENNFSHYFIDLPADAVSNELLFLNFAFKNENLELAKEFLEDEILPYAFKFCDNIINNANTTYYQAFGYLFEDYLNLLKEKFDLKPKKRYINSV